MLPVKLVRLLLRIMPNRALRAALYVLRHRGMWFLFAALRVLVLLGRSRGPLIAALLFGAWVMVYQGQTIRAQHLTIIHELSVLQSQNAAMQEQEAFLHLLAKICHVPAESLRVSAVARGRARRQTPWPRSGEVLRTPWPN